MKKLIVTGPARSGTTAITYLLNSTDSVFIGNELGIFHKNTQVFDRINNEEFLTNNTPFANALSAKNWTTNQFYRMVKRNNYPMEIKYLGDKLPDYCRCDDVRDHIVEHHSDAYFIFTDRTPHAIINSFFERKKREPEKKGSWNVKDIDHAAATLKEYYAGLIDMIPKVKNKILIQYDKAISDYNYLTLQIYKLLGTTIPFSVVEETYTNTQFDAWKKNLNTKEKRFITRNFRGVNNQIESLFKGA